MSYIVSHRANFEPSGHKNYPDKEFESYDDARNYYAEQWKKCRAKADEHIKAYPKLYESEAMKQDLFQDYPAESLDEWELAGFIFHENYAYHTWTLEEL